MKTFLLQNIISLLCFAGIILTFCFSIKNYKLLKNMVKNEENSQIIATNTKTKKKKTQFPMYILIVVILSLFAVPYIFNKIIDINFKDNQLRRLEKLDEYLLTIEEELFNNDQTSEELFSLRKELVSERESILKQGLQEK